MPPAPSAPAPAPDPVAPARAARNATRVISARKAVAALFVMVAGGWLFGLVRYLRADGSVSVTLPRQAPPPADEHNVASWRWGPTVRVSSYHHDPFAQHHPAFLVDERVGPSTLEKWASLPEDAHPFVEIVWREPRTISRVVLRHAGEYESDAETLAAYRLTCLHDGGGGRDLLRGTTLSVVGNRARVAIHPLACANARGLRLDATPGRPGTMVRLYEIEAWGR
jgi:hypothetical protein